MNWVLVVVSKKQSSDKINCKTFPSFNLRQEHEKFSLEKASF